MKVVLIAHDGRKHDMLEWARYNRGTLAGAHLYATCSTGQILKQEIGLEIELLLHGPEGGDAQVAAMIAEKKVDAMVFLWDPLASQAHDADVKALLRLAVLHDVPIACNRRSADFLISSPLFQSARPPLALAR